MPKDFLRKLRALRKDADLRDAEGVFLAEGIHLAQVALETGASIQTAVISAALDATAEGREIRSRLAATGVSVVEISPAELDSVQDARAPQPVLLVVRRSDKTLDETLDASGAVPLVVVACGIQDPGNLGAIFRSALAAGATCAIAAGAGADIFHPRVVRATAGAVFRLPIAAARMDAVLDALDRRHVALVAADPDATIRHDSHDFRVPTALLLGGEGRGLPRDVIARAESRVRIPMQAGVNSLSVGAAAAVLLFEAARQRESTV